MADQYVPIPLGTPVCLKSHMGNTLQNEFDLRRGRCNNKNIEGWEQMIILKTDDGKFIIQSRWDNRNLQVQPDGKCVFANHNQELWEKFEIEADDEGQFFFRSCHTGNFMQCDSNRFAVCAHKNRLGWEAWRIVKPATGEMFTSKQLREVSIIVAASVVLASCVLVPIVGVAAGAMIPTAMSSFGIIVPGVGTIHAAAAAGV